MELNVLHDQEILVIDRPTITGRIFPLQVCQDIVDKFEGCFGQLGMSDDGRVKVESISHKVINLRIVDNQIIGDVKILNTPLGQILQELHPDQYNFRIAGFCHYKNGTSEVADYQLISINAVSVYEVLC
jgi:hypothetical protein